MALKKDKMTLDRLLRRPVRLLTVWVTRTLCLLVLGLLCAGVARAQPIISQLDDNPDPVAAGGTVTYTVGVGSANFTALSNVTLKFTVPATGTYKGLANTPAGTPPEGITCNPANGAGGEVVVTCTGINVAAGQNAKTTLGLMVEATAQPSLKVTASVTDSATGNVNSQEETTAVNAGADLALVMEQPLELPSGGTGVVKLTVTNGGPNVSP